LPEPRRRPPPGRPYIPALLVLLLGAALAGCSLAGPSDHSFAPALGDRDEAVAPAKGEPDQRLKAKLEADTQSCKSIAKQKGISSILAMVKSANRKNTDLDYIACMRKKGWRVEGEPDLAPGAVGSDADQAPPSNE
jgi:hypothetical protein